MNFKVTIPIILQRFSAVLIVITSANVISCASEKSTTVKQVRSQEGLDKYTGDYEYAKDENGMMRATSDKKSSFAEKGDFALARNFQGKDYSKQSYRKERWGNNTQYNTQQYNGNLDGSKFKHSPHYVQKQSFATVRESRFNDDNFSTNRLAKAKNIEANSANVNRDGSGYVESRGKYNKRRVLNRKEYADLTIQQTNSLLGRE